MHTDVTGTEAFFRYILFPATLCHVKSPVVHATDLVLSDLYLLQAVVLASFDWSWHEYGMSGNGTGQVSISAANFIYTCVYW